MYSKNRKCKNDIIEIIEECVPVIVPSRFFMTFNSGGYIINNHFMKSDGMTWTENGAEFITPTKITILNIVGRLSAPPGINEDRIFTIRVNEVDTLLLIKFSGNETVKINSNPIEINALSRISIRATTTTGFPIDASGMVTLQIVD